MKEFIEYIARQLVDNPDAVTLTEESEEDRITYRLKVAPEDVGKIIGKKGRTAFALRTIAAAVGKKSGKTIILEVED